MKNQHSSFSIAYIDFSTFQMKSSKEFCFVCNEPVFFSNRQHLQNHMQKKHQDIYEIILKSDLLKSDDIVSFPGIPCGLVKVCFSFPLEIDGRQATLVLGHRICQKMDCATKWIDNEGNLLFEWTLLFDHDRKEDMSILQAWPNDEKNRSLLANDQPTMICAIHMPQHIKTVLFDTGSLPSVPIDQEAKDAYWRYSGRSKITRDTVTKQFFKGFNIFKLLAEPMKTAKEECKSMPKRLKSVVDVGPFVVEQNAFKIKVLLLDPMVKKQKNKTYYCYSYYKDQRSDKTKLKAKNATAQWKKEKEKEEIKMTDCTSSKYKGQQSDKTKLKSKSKSLQREKEKQKEERKIRVCTSREYNDHHKKNKTKLKAKIETVQWDKENKENKMKASPISFETVVRIRRLSESEINFHAENESLECMRSKSKKRIQSISSVVDSHNSDAANLETDSESEIYFDAENESLECMRTLSSMFDEGILILQPSSQVISSSSFETVVDSHNSDAATLETESASEFNRNFDAATLVSMLAEEKINQPREVQVIMQLEAMLDRQKHQQQQQKHQQPALDSQVVNSTEQQQQQQQQIFNLTNKVNEMQAIMRRLETQKHQQPALDSQVFYPIEQQQQSSQQQKPLFFRRGCPYCRSYLLSTREEMDKHIDDCRTIFLQQDQKPVVKKEEHKDNLDIAQNDLEEDPSVDSLFDEAESYFPKPPPCDFCKFIANTYEEYHTHLTTSHPEMWMSESSDTHILQIPIITLTDDSDDSDDSDEKRMPSTSLPSSAPPPPTRPSSANYKENHCRRSSNNNTTTTTTTTTTNTTENKSSTSRNSTSTNTSSTSRNSTRTNASSTRSSSSTSSTSSNSFKNKLSSTSQHFNMLVNKWKKNPFFVNVESDAEQLIPVADSADSKSKSANSESTNVNMQQQEKHVKEKKKTGNLKRRRQKQQQQSQSSFKRQKK
jgi:hypothetical protein